LNSRIDHSNYEAWLLDRLEGNLSAEQERELDAFLAQYPHLAPDGEPLPSLNPLANASPAFDVRSLKRSLPPKGMVTDAALDDHLIARLEGDLDPEQLRALEKFLYENPLHERTVRLYTLARILPEPVMHALREHLHRHLPPRGLPDRHTLDDHLVARLEGELTAVQEQALTAYLAHHPDAQRQWALMSRSRIEADVVQYPHKAGLKKGGRVIAISFQRTVLRLAAAASIAVLMGAGIWTLFNRPVDVPSTTLVERRTPGVGAEEKAVPAGKVEGHEAPGGAVAPEEAGQPGATISPMPSPEAQEPRMAERGSTTPAVKKEEDLPAPVEPVERELPLYAEQRPVRIDPAVEPPGLVHAQVESVPVAVDEGAMAQVGTTTTENAVSLSGLVAATLRDKVLEQPAADTRPLDGQDALAMVDRGLKALGGDKSGLSVERNAGRVRSFELRLGNGFAISR
jgi:anti-sigma factor RsiW